MAVAAETETPGEAGLVGVADLVGGSIAAAVEHIVDIQVGAVAQGQIEPGAEIIGPVGSHIAHTHIRQTDIDVVINPPAQRKAGQFEIAP